MADHVAADAGDAPARQVQIGLTAAAGAEFVAKRRAVGDRPAIARDQVQPDMRTARELTGRQQVHGKLAGQGRQEEADKTHVVIERQPRDAAVITRVFGRMNVKAVPGNGAGVGHSGRLRDRNTHRKARAARRKLEIGQGGRRNFRKFDPGFGMAIQICG